MGGAVIRWVIVRPSHTAQGIYVHARRNQGSNHFDSPAKACESAVALAPSMAEKLGVRELRVVPWECYPGHGDCEASVFDAEAVLEASILTVTMPFGIEWPAGNPPLVETAPLPEPIPEPDHQVVSTGAQTLTMPALEPGRTVDVVPWTGDQVAPLGAVPIRSCNRHADCDAADAKAIAAGRLTADHCDDSCCSDCCSDCFGK
jgi:hypothetical protein